MYTTALCESNFSCVLITVRAIVSYAVFCFSECEKLIRRMLQLDPAKRIPLAKVLEHRWMLEGENTTQTPLIQNSLRNSSGNLMLNEKVMMAIQRLNFNTEIVKEVRALLFKTYTYSAYSPF